MKYFRDIFFTTVVCCSALMAAQPNPPTWPAIGANGGVQVFDPSDTAAYINGIVNTAYASNGGQNPCNNGQFSTKRFAFLFKPGTYGAGVSVPVGFYTSVIGLGQAPSDTAIPDVYSEQGCADPNIGALDTFWRSAENFATTPTRVLCPECTGSVMQWAVSQACPLRRIQLPAPNLPQPFPPVGIQLWQNQGGDGYASGGYMGDCNITTSNLGNVSSGSQQQWFSRNCKMNWTDNVWNMMFVGCTGDIPATSTMGGYLKPGNAVNTNIAATPVIAEKPYITFSAGKYYLQIPPIEYNKSGPTTDFVTNVTSVPFENVYVVTDPTNVTAAFLQPLIDAGTHIIFTPGIYENLGGPIKVTKPICLLGIGFPTLIGKNGQACIVVADAAGGGVRIGGILFEAGSTKANPSPVLLQVGQTKMPLNQATFLYDCFARVGGPQDPNVQEVSATTMVEINNDNVIVDNAWLWRADHYQITDPSEDGLVKNSQNPCTTGFRANGDNIITYGLAVEHTLGNLLEWYGTNGNAYFFQAEYPYDVTQANYGDKSFSAYKVFINSDPSFTHNAYGIGVYCFFRDNIVVVPNGIATSGTGQGASGVKFTNVLTKYLTGNGGITNVINTIGGVVQGPNGSGPLADDVSTVSSFSPANTFYPRTVRRAP